MVDSILQSVKQILGIHPEDESFDVNVVFGINTVLATLTQIGFGPPGGYIVSNYTDTWMDIIGDRKDAEFVKTYVCMKTKMIFDPPTSSAAIESMNKIADELEWRIANLRG